jgi:hypothetical protein
MVKKCDEPRVREIVKEELELNSCNEPMLKKIVEEVIIGEGQHLVSNTCYNGHFGIELFLLQHFVIVPGEAYTLSPYQIYQVYEFSVCFLAPVYFSHF